MATMRLPVQVENRVLAAAGLVILAMALIGFIDNYVRVIATEAGLWQFHATRAAIALPLIWVLARLVGWRLRPKSFARVMGRSLFASTSMLVYFGCLALLPIGEVVAGLFTAPIFVLLISALVLGIRVGTVQLLAVALGFGGILLVLKLDPGNLTLLSLMPVLAGLLYAIGNIVTREWCMEENFLTLLFGFFTFMALWGLIGLAVLALVPQAVPAGTAGFILRGWAPPTPVFLFWTLVQACGSVLGVGMIIRAYQIALAPHVSVFENSLLIFAAAFAWLLWGETLDFVAMAGMAAIGISGAMIALQPGRTA